MAEYDIPCPVCGEQVGRVEQRYTYGPDGLWASVSWWVQHWSVEPLEDCNITLIEAMRTAHLLNEPTDDEERWADDGGLQ